MLIGERIAIPQRRSLALIKQSDIQRSAKLEIGGFSVELDERVLEAILGVRPVLQTHHTGGGNILGILLHCLLIAQSGIQLAPVFAHFVPPFIIYTHEKPIWFQ